MHVLLQTFFNGGASAWCAAHPSEGGYGPHLPADANTLAAHASQRISCTGAMLPPPATGPPAFIAPPQRGQMRCSLCFANASRIRDASSFENVIGVPDASFSDMPNPNEHVS